jgi:hypothetical protein
MGMKPGHVLAAIATDKLHFTENLGGILLGCERSITVLHVVGGHQDILGNFNKLFPIAALGADNASGRFTGGDMDFFHKRIWKVSVKMLVPVVVPSRSADLSLFVVGGQSGFAMLVSR